jgi:hypothetical protein
MLTNVQILNLSSCGNITDEGVRHLSHVHTLNLDFCPLITGEGIRHLSNYCGITDETLHYLSHIPELDFARCCGITDFGFVSLNISEIFIVYLCPYVNNSQIPRFVF